MERGKEREPKLVFEFEEVIKYKKTYSEKISENRKEQLQSLERLKKLKEEEDNLLFVVKKIEDCYNSYPKHPSLQKG
jgi:hypothetical protein